MTDNGASTAVSLPNPAGATVPSLVSGCRAIYDRRDELIGQLEVGPADELRRRVSAIARYLSGKEGRNEARRAARVLELAVGAALGPAEDPRRNEDGTLTGSLASEAVSIPKDDRYRFRRMYEHRDVWEPELDKRALTRAEVLRIIDSAHESDGPRQQGVVEDLVALIDTGYRAGTVYADPPWRYNNQGTRAATSDHYTSAGMSVDELCELPVGDVASDNAHLHLWVTNAFLFEAPRIFDAWGFEFKSSFVWCKNQMGIGNYWRLSHEFLLTAVRGNATRFSDRNLMSWDVFDRTKHSAKPEAVRAFIERASPPPYLELFGRKPVEDWAVWGDDPRLSQDMLYTDSRVLA